MTVNQLSTCSVFAVSALLYAAQDLCLLHEVMAMQKNAMAAIASMFFFFILLRFLLIPL